MVSEGKTEIRCLQTKGTENAPVTVTAFGQVNSYKQAIEFVYWGGAATKQASQ